ncbi:MAG: 16S rRNA (cytosine(967)-C(5))-methyltransferase RsmB [Myxococcaceae bacterium]|nr:16S rRNA (cytosine(967)-C(5))-methyltransferase RsmB [Myxococcaceae bacterium]
MGARAVALQVLTRVTKTDAFLNVVLDGALDGAGLEPRDAAFTTELCYGTARRQLTLDFALKPYSSQALDHLEDDVLAALRLGAYQLFFTRVPRHAAVAETVEALKVIGKARAAGYANAVLRKLAALTELPLPPPEPVVDRLSVEHAHPRWLVERWRQQFGPERAAAMLAADNEAPLVVVRANSARITRDALVQQLREVGVACEPTRTSTEGVVLSAPGRVEDLFGFAEGLWQVQDEAAQLVGAFAAPADGARVLDVCAAPGGKACHLAQRCEVTALDVFPARLAAIARESKRLGLSDRLKLGAPADASKPLPESLGEFDLVLVDAPCSGLGTLRRHPELRWRRLEDDLPRLRALQRKILEHAFERVAPGGLLVYAVCSVDPSEGADQIEPFLRSHPELTTEPPPAADRFPTWQGHLRTLMGPEGMDGHFAARLRRMY